ncbi:MAG: 50S ribosomal protein L29 [Sedimentisphaerales bacterium]|jgi:large subunit ribosomal protein L29|nr:50S ribosomal protein L29 [Sedimentisphaerales bacterium]MCK5272845.1 50S ribosomal protein L29 [Sedimentisphaerales bacterium]
MKASEIREMNPDELEGELETLERRLFDIRSQAVTEKLEDPTQLSKAKRDIARVKTVIRERELLEQEKEQEQSE